MKKLTTLILFLFISSSLFSQNDLSVGTQWYNSTHFYPYLGAALLEISGDTVINGQEVSIIQGVDPCAAIYSEYIYQNEGKMYYYNDLTDGFSLLYDFTAQAGDTISIETQLTANGGYWIQTEVVDSVSQEYIAGAMRIVQYTDQNINIEGIGALCYLFPQIPVCDIQYGHIRCFIDGATREEVHYYNTYFQEDFPCDTSILIVATRELIVNRSLKIYPNPTSDYITIDIPDAQSGKISIRNSIGLAVKEVEVASSVIKTEVGLYNLPAGVYFVEFVPDKNNERVIYSGKVEVVR